MTSPRRADFSRPTHGSFGKLLAMFLLAGLSLVVYWSAKRGLADVIALEPRYQIERWRATKFVPDNGQRDEIQSELNKALDLDPHSPRLLDDMGRFHATAAERGKSFDPEVIRIRQQALGWYGQLLQQQPTSGHAWVNFALTKHRLGEIDSGLSLALQQALHRAPWDPKIQLLVIEIGLASWQAQSADMQQILRQAIRTQGQWQFVKQKPALEALLKRYRRPELACLLEAAPVACEGA